MAQASAEWKSAAAVAATSRVVAAIRAGGLAACSAQACPSRCGVARVLEAGSRNRREALRERERKPEMTSANTLRTVWQALLERRGQLFASLLERSASPRLERRFAQ